MIKQSNHPYRLDQGESVLFARDLEYIKTRTYDVKLKELKAITIIPISTDAGPAATEIVFHRYTGVGFAKIISDYAKDFPRVDVYGEEDSLKIKAIGTSYGYSIQEIRASQMAGKSLDQRRATASRRAHDEEINSIALKSRPKFGTRGLLDYPGITEATLPANGSQGKKWSGKTVDQILADINILTDSVMIPTYGREVPDTLLLSLPVYNLLANTRLGDNETTLLQYILNNNPHLTKIDWLLELAGAGEGGTDRMLVGTYDEEHITLEIPQPFEQFDAQQEGMEYVIPCHSRVGGVIIYYPMAFAYADGM